jgi:hypothetical protein
VGAGLPESGRTLDMADRRKTEKWCTKCIPDEPYSHSAAMP